MAAAQQRSIDKSRDSQKPLDPKNTSPIGIRDVNGLVSFVHYAKRVGDGKIDQIIASRFGTPSDLAIREPLIGEIDPSLVEKTVSKNRFELQLCFELALRRNQQLNGTMEWRWMLDSQGTISNLELVSSSINDRPMIRCIQQKISKWRFPRPRRGAVEVRFPFNFVQKRG